MNKLVYLFELDSVRNSPEEIARGQWALYEEIVIRGNSVAITFNQLADSQALLAALRNEKSGKALEWLFQRGCIVVSQYRNESGTIVRTPAQYLGNAASESLKDRNAPFVFSALPFSDGVVDKELLLGMEQALNHADPNIFEALKTKDHIGQKPSHARCDCGNMHLREDCIDYMERWTKLVLDVSMMEKAMNPPCEESAKIPLCDFLDRALRLIPSLSLKYTMDDDRLRCVDTLRAIEESIQTCKGMNSRSTWYEHLGSYPVDSAVCLAFCVVDLCYGYACESSIAGVSRHCSQNDWGEDFTRRLESYWQDYLDGVHSFGTGSCSSEQLFGKYDNLRLPKWQSAELAVRKALEKTGLGILDRSILGKFSSAGEHMRFSAIAYEQSYSEEKKQWSARLFSRGLAGVVLPLFVLFVVLELAFASSSIEGRLSSWGLISNSGYLLSFTNILAYSLLLAVMCFASRILGAPDFLGAVIGVVKALIDDVYIACLCLCLDVSYKGSLKVAGRYPGYKKLARNRNAFAGRDVQISVAPKAADWAVAHGDRYARLQVEQPSLFKQSDELPLVSDAQVVHAWELANNRQIGVIYESQYNLLVVDLVQPAGSEPFAYERVIPAVEGAAVVIVPCCEGKFVLLEQYRHAPRGKRLAFPRGYGNEDLKPSENAIKEVREELGVQVSKCEYLGRVEPDTGLTAACADVFAVEVDNVNIEDGYEGICRYELVNEDELKAMIASGEISDGFTLSAYLLFALKSALDANASEDHERFCSNTQPATPE